jgi:hypothetical protein
MKRYKRERIPGSPDWMPEMPVVRKASTGEVGILTRYDLTDARMTYYIEGLGWTHEVIPVQVWEPQGEEIVAKWGRKWFDTAPVEFEPYGEDWGTFPRGRIARIPDNYKLTAETITVAWWEAHGEIFEAGDE